MTRERLRFGGGRPAARSALLPEGASLPGSLIGIGDNYRPDRSARSRAPERIPLVFGKFASSVIGHGMPIGVAPGSGPVVCEGELALVVGRRAHRVVTARAALETLAGVCIANDVSARDQQAADGQSTRGKSHDGFCPLGPELVTLDELPDLDTLEIVTRVNGRVVQRANTGQMVFSAAELIIFCSEFMTLYPGDVILTGTPVASDAALRIRPGDAVAVSISGLGTLENPVVTR
ncbi:fumarylacetoacetate hydrolase family protein [Nocardia sp. NPDC004582]